MSDHKLFNCSEQHEHDYVTSKYTKEQRLSVRAFLKLKCHDNTLYYSTHKEVYELIKKELGFTPVQ